MNTNYKKGFTLLELLIVVAIIAVLSTVLIVAINPAETLRKTRDTQRISDLASLKTAVGVYVTSIPTPLLDNVDNNLCVNGTGQETLWLSVPTATDDVVTNDVTPPAGFAWAQEATVSAASPVDGTGWIPVNLASITGGSPISNMPLDPVNDASITTGAHTSTVSAVNNGAQIYRYTCEKNNVQFEVNARLESTAYGVGGTDDKASKDGGNNANLYEIGTILNILPSTNDF